MTPDALPTLVLQTNYCISILLPVAIFWCSLVWWKRYRNPPTRLLLIFTGFSAVSSVAGGVLTLLLTIPVISEYIYLKSPLATTDHLFTAMNLIASIYNLSWVLSSIAFLAFCIQLPLSPTNRVGEISDGST